MIIDGRKIKDELLVAVRTGVEALPFVPIFCDILVGDDPASIQYVAMKAKIAESVGIKFRTANFPASVTTQELVEAIESLNRVPYMCGIIVQLPLPMSLDKDVVLDAIDSMLDVDCLGSRASEAFYENRSTLAYPTARACMHILDVTGVDVSQSKIVMLGQGMLVGRPVTHLLRTRGYDVTPVTRATPDALEILKEADVIISAIGQGKYIKGDMIQKGALIIDAGTSEDNGAVVGDVDMASVEAVASYVSPTPGGVGPVTVAMLLANVLLVAQQHRS